MSPEVESTLAAIERALRHQGRPLRSEAEIDALSEVSDERAALEELRAINARTLAVSLVNAEAIARHLGLWPLGEWIVLDRESHGS
jgi:hypothetical protein